MRRSAALGRVSIFLLSLLTGCQSGNEHRIGRNEFIAVGRMQTTQSLQQQYAAAHPEKGFACDLRSLLPFEKYTQEEWRGRGFFYLQGIYSGFSFKIVNCRAEPNGIVMHYQFIAEPALPGESGTHVFCTDESGVIWFDGKYHRFLRDENGSASRCLTNRKPYSIDAL
jgi:hypothetical protein